MNKYFFKLKMVGCETNTWEQRTMWADTPQEAFDELRRVYGPDVEIEQIIV